jgi:mycoredoxin
MTPERKARLDQIRRALLWIAAGLALLLYGLDRYAAWAHRPGANDTAVVIYTTAWCPYCARLRTALAANAVPYVEHDVEKSLQGQMGFWALRGRGVPVSVIGPTVVYGYDVGRIGQALGALGYAFAPGPGEPAHREKPAQSRI